MLEAFKTVCMETLPEKVWRLFLRSAAANGGLGSRAGLFPPLIYGGVLPPPAVPLAFARGQGFPP